MLLERHVEMARLQQVADAQQHLELLERLGEEVAGTRRQRAALGLQRDIRRQDEDGHVRIGRDLAAELLEDGEPVEVRHHQVEQDEVRLEVVAGVLQQPLHEQHVGRLVVDDEDPRLPQAVRNHVVPWGASAASISPRSWPTSSGLVK